MPRTAHVIANPKGGVGDNASLLAETGRRLRRQGYVVRDHLTAAPKDAESWAAGLSAAPSDLLCVIGGDGTIHEAVNGLMRRPADQRPVLGLIPGGTGNSFLRDFDLADPRAALDRVLNGRPKAIDLLEVRTQSGVLHAFNIVGYGLFSAANERAEKLRWLGKRRYDVAGLIEILKRRSYPGALTADGKRLCEQSQLFVLSNTKHSGEGLRIAPDAEVDDGRMDILVVENAPRLALMRLFLQLPAGAHVRSPWVRVQQAVQASFDGSSPLALNIDGEQRATAPFTVAVRPKALDILL